MKPSSRSAWNTAEPRPSPTDIGSLFGIASAPNYLTRCPVMIIAGYDPSAGKVAGLFAWSFPVAGRVYPIALEDHQEKEGL